MNKIIKVIIPAYNEEKSIIKVIQDIPSIVDEIIIVDNNSSDQTAKNAQEAGAKVLTEIKKGYGNACLKGISYVKSQTHQTDIIVFLDGDFSDYPEELTKLIAPIINDNIDFVIGARVSRFREKGSMTRPQIFGNWLATTLMSLLFNSKFTDLGPFRAIKYHKLLALKMEDKTYGWTIEMQLKALKNNYSYLEIPVKYRNRIGVSKVSGTIKGAIFAGVNILYCIL